MVGGQVFLVDIHGASEKRPVAIYFSTDENFELAFLFSARTLKNIYPIKFSYMMRKDDQNK